VAKENENGMEGWGHPTGNEHEQQKADKAEQASGGAQSQETEVDLELERAREKAKKYKVSWFESFLQMFEGMKSLFGKSKLTYSERRDKLEASELDFDTTEEMSKKRNSAFKKRMSYIIIFAPIIMLVIVGVIKGIFKYQEQLKKEQEYAKVAEKMHTDRMELGSDAMKDSWKSTFEYRNNKRNRIKRIRIKNRLRV